jgi:hypothetical protein
MVMQVGRGTQADRNGKGLVEYLRSDGKGRGVNSEYQLVSKASTATAGNTVKNNKQSASSREPQARAHHWGWSGWQQSPRNEEVYSRSRGCSPTQAFGELCARHDFLATTWTGESIRKEAHRIVLESNKWHLILIV